MTASGSARIGEYVTEHLTYLSNKPQTSLINFTVINYDTVFFSVLLAVLFAGSFYWVARRMASGTPARRAASRASSSWSSSGWTAR